MLCRIALRVCGFLIVLAPAVLTTSVAWSQTLALRFVDTSAQGLRISASGHVLGRKTIWPCGDPSACAPQIVPTVWTARGAFPLPTEPGLFASPAAISRRGVVVGALTDFGSNSKAVIWRLEGGAYQVTELGDLGLEQSAATGIDASGRVVGFAITPYIATKPFRWTASGGMVDLTLAGFPADRPMDVSPRGRVVSDGYTYLLDDVATVAPLPGSPPGFYAPTGQGMRVNNAGDLVAGLLTTTSHPLLGLFRYRVVDGQWQALTDAAPLGFYAPTSIEKDATVTGIGLGGAMIAAGPSQLPSALQDRLSPAYADAGVALTSALGRDAGGRFLANAFFGKATRLVKVVAIQPCAGLCLRVSSLVIAGKFVADPKHPGACTAKARNRVETVATVTDTGGVPQVGVRVRGVYLDTYALKRVVSGRTDAAGRVTLSHEGPACVGTVSLLVTSVRRPGWRLDRGVGVLAAEVIPVP